MPVRRGEKGRGREVLPEGGGGGGRGTRMRWDDEGKERGATTGAASLSASFSYKHPIVSWQHNQHGYGNNNNNNKKNSSNFILSINCLSSQEAEVLLLHFLLQPKENVVQTKLGNIDHLTIFPGRKGFVDVEWQPLMYSKNSRHQLLHFPSDNGGLSAGLYTPPPPPSLSVA